MALPYMAILIATVLQFIFGAIWYGPIFGKMWGTMHGFEKHTPEEQKEMMKGMWKLLVGQFLVTIVTSTVFAILLTGFPTDWNIYGLAGFFWLGFVVPTQVSAILFGGTEPKWIVTKFGIMAVGSLGCLMILAAVMSMF
ncbi:MAG: hypothetical protein JWO50_729 [Candidatus Kaiserbacteria bacterium]|nr:hypothetical protein [Candidatus Kaiserbacteria bacterium]